MIFFRQFSLWRWFGCAVPSQKNVGKQTKGVVNVLPENIFYPKNQPVLLNSKWAQQFVMSIGLKYGGATTGAWFLTKTIHEASGNSDFLRDFFLSQLPQGQHLLDTSQVQGGAINAVPEWMKKQGLPYILTTSHWRYELLNRLVNQTLVNCN